MANSFESLQSAVTDYSVLLQLNSKVVPRIKDVSDCIQATHDPSIYPRNTAVSSNYACSSTMEVKYLITIIQYLALKATLNPGVFAIIQIDKNTRSQRAFFPPDIHKRAKHHFSILMDP